MTKFLKNLQNKPDHIKQTIMLVGVTLTMLIIFIFWIATFPWQTPSAPENEASLKLKQEMPSVFQSLKSQSGTLFNLLKGNGK